tara:strand:- start:385 stop:1533 length:1149 start_codon:yes stop_codon:yes gene_type:complete
MKTAKQKNKFRKNKIYKKYFGGVSGTATRKSGRTRTQAKTLLTESSKQFQADEDKKKLKKQERQTKLKEAKIKEQKDLKEKQQEKQQEIAKVSQNDVNKEILNPVPENNIVLNSTKKKFNFRDILVWQSLGNIKKIIQKDLLGYTTTENNDSTIFNKYGILHVSKFEKLFKSNTEKYNNYEEFKKLNSSLNSIAKIIINDNPKLQKYPGLALYAHSTFEEFKTKIFPQSQILKEYDLFSHLVNFYYDIEFSHKGTNTGIKYNSKAKSRIMQLKSNLQQIEFIKSYSRFNSDLTKLQDLDTKLLNSDLPDNDNNFYLTDKDVTDNLSERELQEYIDDNLSLLFERQLALKRRDSEFSKTRSRSRSKSRSKSHSSTKKIKQSSN